MIFWIIATLVAAGTITVFIKALWDGPLVAFFVALFTLIVGGFLGLMLWIGSSFVLADRDHVVVHESTQQLKALGNANGIEGHSYFLGGGYVEDKRVLNYITQGSDGAIRVERSDADASTIFEGSDNATVEITVTDESNPWVSPWPINTRHSYEFHIPTGSVVESYELDNK